MMHEEPQSGYKTSRPQRIRMDTPPSSSPQPWILATPKALRTARSRFPQGVHTTSSMRSRRDTIRRRPRTLCSCMASLISGARCDKLILCEILTSVKVHMAPPDCPVREAGIPCDCPGHARLWWDRQASRGRSVPDGQAVERPRSLARCAGNS